MPRGKNDYRRAAPRRGFQSTEFELGDTEPMEYGDVDGDVREFEFQRQLSATRITYLIVGLIVGFALCALVRFAS